jgi:glycosyltransferase involved in cell wall biosynthesis
MSRPQITAFIPVYNGAEYLADAISSVLLQEGPSFELLIVDDHSTDGTPDIIRDFQARDARVRSIRNPVNRGESFAANVAIQEARGRFLVRLDADDQSLPGRHRLQFEALQGGEIHVVGSAIETFGARDGRVDYPLADGLIKARFLACANNIANPASAIDLAFVHRHGLRYREDLRVGQDLHFWIACMAAGAKFRNLAEALARYRLHGGQSGWRHPGPLLSAQFEARLRLLAMWFPQQPEDVRRAVAGLLANTLTRPIAERGFVAVERLLADNGRSRHGEDRRWVAAYLRSWTAAVRKAMSELPKP